MATHLLAYVPYAAAAFCITKVGRAVWPTIRSQMSAMTHYSSVHGMDGEDPYEARIKADCPTGGMTGVEYYANPGNPYVRNAPSYCYNVDTGVIEGSGPLDGTRPPPSSVAVWTDDDGSELATINVAGDATITVPLCGGGDQLVPPRGGGTPPERVPPRRIPPPPSGEPCGRRRRSHPAPTFRRSDCGDRARQTSMRMSRWS